MNASADSPVLELRDLHKRYGNVPALRGLELRLQRGQVYGFLGRNGAGKSTTLRIIMGITRQERGDVALFGSSVKASDVRPRQRIGYVAQEQTFYDWMTPERLGRFVSAFYPTWDAPHYVELLRRFDLPSRKIATFSGGMKVKQALALALAHRPELLVLDEPTAGLDAVVRREFIEILRELTASGQHTTLFSSHLIGEVELVATRVGIVEEGLMRYEGSLPDLAARVRVLSLPREADAASDPVGFAAVPALLTDLPVRVLTHAATSTSASVKCLSTPSGWLGSRRSPKPAEPMRPVASSSTWLAATSREKRPALRSGNTYCKRSAAS